MGYYPDNDYDIEYNDPYEDLDRDDFDNSDYEDFCEENELDPSESESLLEYRDSVELSKDPMKYYGALY